MWQVGKKVGSSWKAWRRNYEVMLMSYNVPDRRMTVPRKLCGDRGKLRTYLKDKNPECVSIKNLVCYDVDGIPTAKFFCDKTPKRRR